MTKYYKYVKENGQLVDVVEITREEYETMDDEGWVQQESEEPVSWPGEDHISLRPMADRLYQPFFSNIPFGPEYFGDSKWNFCRRPRSVTVIAQMDGLLIAGVFYPWGGVSE